MGVIGGTAASASNVGGRPFALLFVVGLHAPPLLPSPLPAVAEEQALADTRAAATAVPAATRLGRADGASIDIISAVCVPLAPVRYSNIPTRDP